MCIFAVGCISYLFEVLQIEYETVKVAYWWNPETLQHKHATGLPVSNSCAILLLLTTSYREIRHFTLHHIRPL